MKKMLPREEYEKRVREAYLARNANTQSDFGKHCDRGFEVELAAGMWAYDEMANGTDITEHVAAVAAVLGVIAGNTLLPFKDNPARSMLALMFQEGLNESLNRILSGDTLESVSLKSDG